MAECAGTVRETDEARTPSGPAAPGRGAAVQHDPAEAGGFRGPALRDASAGRPNRRPDGQRLLSLGTRKEPPAPVPRILSPRGDLRFPENRQEEHGSRTGPQGPDSRVPLSAHLGQQNQQQLVRPDLE